MNVYLLKDFILNHKVSPLDGDTGSQSVTHVIRIYSLVTVNVSVALCGNQYGISVDIFFSVTFSRCITTADCICKKCVCLFIFFNFMARFDSPDRIIPPESLHARFLHGHKTLS